MSVIEPRLQPKSFWTFAHPDPMDRAVEPCGESGAGLLPDLVRIRERQQETDDTFTLTIAPADPGSALRPFQPGQFNMLYVFGTGEIPISISGGNPQEGLMHTTRAVGSVTRAMSKLAPGAMLGLRGPFGRPWPVDAAAGRDVVLVAGGIGLAPLRPAVQHFVAHRDRYRKIVLLYGARTQEDMLYRSELEQWRARFDLDIFVTVDRATGDWRGTVGLVTTLIRRAPFDPRNAVAMICGPEIMMWHTVQTLKRRGVDAESVYLSLERNMQCGTGICGHCQLGPVFVCRDGPVFRYASVADLMAKPEV